MTVPAGETAGATAGGGARGCAICGRAEADARLLATCYGCRRPFHLNPDAGPGRDCGDVWAGSSMGEDFTGLELYCAPCFEERLKEAAPVPVTPARAAPPPRPERAPWPRRYRRRDGGGA